MSYSWAKQYQPTNPFMKYMDERLPLPRFVYNAVGGGYPVPRNLNFFWNFGVLAGAALMIQIITGIVLAMHYAANASVAFDTVEHIMRDVNAGWFVRYAHMNGASMFFIVVYLHIFRGLYYGSYKAPREMIWLLGLVIFLLMMATAFMGYVLPWGQMSFWGAKVITGLFGAIPLVGEPIQTWLLGGFAPDNAALNRFFSLHFVMPFIIAGVIILHVWALHIPGSSNPTGVSVKSEQDTVPFHPYYTAKDAFGVAIFLIVFAGLLFFAPSG
jgi:ubiquinol-cytochrome c reductase cytochrome b subunit